MVLITRVEIENFYSHRNTTVDFDHGINMIVGPNGAGKSSILNAIRFALFGKERDTDPVMHGSSRCHVLLEFQIESDTYTVSRSFGQKQADREASLLKNGSQVATSQDPVSREVQNIIGMDQSVFEGSVFIRQGEIDAIVNQRPRERKNFFAQILGIEKLTKASAVVHSSIQRLKDRSIDLQGKTGQIEYLRRDLDTGKTALKGIHEEIEKIQVTLNAVRSDEERLQNRRKDLEMQVEEVRSQRSSLELLKSEVTADSAEIAQLKQASGDLQGIQAQIERIESNPLFSEREQIFRLPDLEKRLHENELRMSELQKDATRLSQMQLDLKELEPVHEKWREMNEELGSLKKEHSILQEKETEWVLSERKSSELGQKLQKLERDSERRKPEVAGLFGLQEVTPEILSEKRDSIRSSLSEITDNISKKKAEIGSRNTKIRDLRHDLASIEGKADCPLCGTRLTPDHIVTITSQMNESISSYMQEIEEADRIVGALQDEKNSLDLTLEKLSQPSIVSYPDLNTEIEKNRAELDQVNRQLQELSRYHSKFSESTVRQRELEKQIANMDDAARKYVTLHSAVDERTKSDPESRITEIRKTIDALKQETGKVLSVTGMEKTTDAVEHTRKMMEEHGVLQKQKENFQDASRRLEEKIKSIYDKKLKISETESRLESSKGVMEEYRSLMTDIEKVGNEISRHGADLSSRRREQTTLEERVSDLSARLSDLEESERGLQSLNSAILLLEDLKKAYSVDGIQRYIRKKASEFITNGARQFLASFSLDFDDLEVSEDFDITILRNGPIEISALSGGEKISLAIALRMSISKFLDQEQRMNCFLMDEPTTYLDQERRSNLRDLLHYALGGTDIAPQVIMITHHTELTSAGDAVFEVSKKDSRSLVSSY